jgi:radical SAM protein with 4Fe4S-binding SPASM domain
MNEDFLKAFKRYDVHLSMSLPGIDTFAQHTGVDNAAGVLHWFEEAKKMGIHTTVNVTVTKLNYHELFKTLAMGLIAGADTVLLNRFLPGGRGMSYINDLMLSNEQLNGMLNTAEEVLEYSNRTGAVGTEFPRCIVDDIDRYKRLYISTMCAAAKDFFVVDPSGYIRICNHSPRKVGHIFDKDIVSDVEYWNCFSTRAYIPKQCIGCGEVNFCDCGCREAAAILKGRINEMDPCFDNNN